MELKRYVLLKNNEIVDTSIKSERYDSKCDWYILDNLLLNDDITKDPRVYLAITDHDMFEIIGDIKKTSDNILDLVEVGDCVEWDFGYIESLSNLKLKDLDELGEVFVALWKRNGNIMTRYEVSK